MKQDFLSLAGKLPKYLVNKVNIVDLWFLYFDIFIRYESAGMLKYRKRSIDDDIT